MALSDLLLPAWVKPALCAAALLGAFSAGWKVESWRWGASEAKALQQAQKRAAKQQDKIHTEGMKYEQGKEAARVANGARQQTIRTIYQDRVVPGDCAAPDAVRSVLQDGVRSANSQARGESVAAVPPVTGPAGRPD